MAKQPQKPKSSSKGPVTAATQSDHPLSTKDDGLGPLSHQKSQDLIYQSIMKGGGEAFGAPFEVALSTLTEKIVRFFKQTSFFGFETFEPSRQKKWRNRFTRYGASRYFGQYDVVAANEALAAKNEADAKAAAKAKAQAEKAKKKQRKKSSAR